MDYLEYKIHNIKNKYFRLAAAHTLAAVMLGFGATLVVMVTTVLHPLYGYSYLQVFVGWLVIGLAVDRVQIAWRDRQRRRFYRGLTQ